MNWPQSVSTSVCALAFVGVVWLASSCEKAQSLAREQTWQLAIEHNCQVVRGDITCIGNQSKSLTP